MFKQYKLKNYRFRLIAYVILLTLIGIMVIGSAKESVQVKQIYGLVLGLVLMVIASLIDYSLILKFRRVIYLLVIILLGIVLVPGVGVNVNGSTRWIEVAGIQFQPSELCKILLILFFAAYFMRVREKLNSLRYLIFSLILIGIPLLLIYKEPDLSTTIMTTLIFITLIFVGGLSYKIIAGILGVTVPIGIIGLILVLKKAVPFLEDYQYDRIFSWIYPEKYVDKSRQQVNSIIAIGSGRLWGKGLNNSSVVSLKNGNFILEPQTDFIFTVVGEELGFVGCMTIMILVLLIVFDLILIAKNAKDLGGRLICCGMAALIGFQTFINIGVTSGLLPNTGLPLPFVSYGLTSLVSLYIGIGVVLNVGLQTAKANKTDLFEV